MYNQRFREPAEVGLLRADFQEVASDRDDTGLPNSGFLAIYGIMFPEIKL